MGFTPANLDYEQEPHEPTFGEVAWICGRIPHRTPEEAPNAPRFWHIQGLFTHEHLAIAGCADDTYFIYPIHVNVCLPHDLIEAVGAYFPLRTGNDKTQTLISEMQHG